MDKLEMLVETICAGGVILTPFWLTYKLVLYVIS